MKKYEFYIKGIIIFIGIILGIDILFFYLSDIIYSFKSFFLNFGKIQTFFLLFCIQEIIYISILLFSFNFGIKIKDSVTSLIKKFNIIEYYKERFIWVGIKNFLKYTFGMFFVYCVFMIIFYSALSSFNIELPGFSGNQTISVFMESLKNVSNFDFLLLFFAIVILGPIVEELIYRGFIQEIILNKFSTRIAIFLSAFIFAVSHFEFSSLGALFILSLFISYIYYKTKSLFCSLGFHMIINLSSFLIIFFLHK